MNTNKVDFGGQTLIDLTSDTVTPEALLEGIIAHVASGEQVVGTLKPIKLKSGSFTLAATATSDYVIEHGLGEMPDYFIIYLSDSVDTRRTLIFEFTDYLNGTDIICSRTASSDSRPAVYWKTEPTDQTTDENTTTIHANTSILTLQANAEYRWFAIKT